MKIVILIVVCLFLIIFLGKPEISFSPFKFKLTETFVMIGWIFIISGLILFSVNDKKKGYKEGFSKAYELRLEEVESSLSTTAYNEGYKNGAKKAFDSIENTLKDYEIINKKDKKNN